MIRLDNDGHGGTPPRVPPWPLAFFDRSRDKWIASIARILQVPPEKLHLIHLADPK